MDKNILLKIAYDGAGFHGWQRQPDKPTVQGHLETVLSRLFKTEILLNGTSRTDAGVHALGQQASFKADVNIPVEKLARVVNNALCGCEKGSFAISPVRIVEAEEKPPEFHARFDARGKTYIYKIRNTQTIDIFQRNYVYHVAEPLDTDAMRQAAKFLAGTHDFKSFEASGSTPRESTVRTIYRLELLQKEDLLELHVTGDGFLYNMVRILAGTLVDVGRGRICPEQMTEILDAKDRQAAGHTAPPFGLYLSVTDDLSSFCFYISYTLRVVLHLFVRSSVYSFCTVKGVLDGVGSRLHKVLDFLKEELLEYEEQNNDCDPDHYNRPVYLYQACVLHHSSPPSLSYDFIQFTVLGVSPTVSQPVGLQTSG